MPKLLQHAQHSFKNCLHIRPDLGVELTLRVLTYIAFLITDDAVPFRRIIQPEEVWLYKFPHQQDIIPFKILQLLSVVTSLLIVWAIYKTYRNLQDAISALLGVSLSSYLSLTITNFIKLAVGRPRPDFFARCFTHPPEDDHTLSQAQCDKPADIVNQGYKSFPSGHSTMVFGCMVYLSCYIAWSLRVFNQPNLRYPCFRLCAFLSPLVFAILVAASRTADYHHHWQDVLVGSLIGSAVAYMCYRQGFPGFTEKRSYETHPLSPTPEPFNYVLNIA